MGIIKLKPDPNFLEAASVTAAVNPIEIRRDTVIYNAAAFKTALGANLGDLLKKMPGVEVGENGSITVNGKAVSKITVGGRTFFMGDNSVALNNIPASIVDKVKVIDKESDAAQFSGAKESEREKVMDVELKEEYKNGYFGNISLGLGASIPSKSQNEYLVNKYPLYGASGMISSYTEKSQVTAVANLSNYPELNSYQLFGITELPPEILNNAPSNETIGTTTTASAGVSVDSDRINGFSTKASVLWFGMNKKYRDASSSITAYENYDLNSDTETEGNTRNENVSFKMEIKTKTLPNGC